MYAVITKSDEKIIAKDFHTRAEAINWANRKVLYSAWSVIDQNTKRFAIIQMKNKPKP